MATEVHVKVLFFAKARELVGRSEAAAVLPSVSDKLTLLEVLESRFPELKVLNRCFVLAVNEEYVEDDAEHNLSSNDELAVIPPISGG